MLVKFQTVYTGAFTLGCLIHLIGDLDDSNQNPKKKAYALGRNLFGFAAWKCFDYCADARVDVVPAAARWPQGRAEHVYNLAAWRDMTSSECYSP